MSSIKGLDKLLAGLDKASRQFQSDVKDIISVNIGELELDAIRSAPGPSDQIATQYGSENERDIVNGRGWTPISQAITSQIAPDGYSGRVIVNDSAGPISAWIEFGTGQSARQYLVSVPTEWRELAKRYYITGTGTILARPYLYPAFQKYSIQALKEIKQAMKDIKI